MVGKGENAGTSIFSFSRNVFLPNCFCYIWFVVYKCFQFGLAEKFYCLLNISCKVGLDATCRTMNFKTRISVANIDFSSFSIHCSTRDIEDICFFGERSKLISSSGHHQ